MPLGRSIHLMRTLVPGAACAVLILGQATAAAKSPDPEDARAVVQAESQGAKQTTGKGKGKGKKGSKKKGATEGSMDEGAGQPDGSLAPGTDDSKATETETTDSKASSKSKGKGKGKASNGKKASEEQAATPAPESDIEVTDTSAETAAPPPEPEPAEPPPRFLKNWVSLSLQQEALFFSALQGVCAADDGMGNTTPGAAQYSCRDGSGLYDGPVYADAGNEIRSGIGLATTRVLVGYDRVFIEQLTLGGRVGYAFGGAPEVPGGGGFVPYHAELRAAYYFGQTPFERKSIRPFVSLAVGMAEVNGKVSVDFYVNEDQFRQGRRGRLDAWRKTGTGFGSLGGGFAYPIGPIALMLEARALMMFGEPALALALAGGVAYGL